MAHEEFLLLVSVDIFEESKREKERNKIKQEPFNKSRRRDCSQPKNKGDTELAQIKEPIGQGCQTRVRK